MIKLIASDLDGTLLKEGTMDINPEIYDIIRAVLEHRELIPAISLEDQKKANGKEKEKHKKKLL